MSAAACLVAAGLTLSAAHGSAGEPLETVRHAYVMGTRVTLAARGERTAARGRLERMLARLEASEAELSTWRSDSLLSTLNAQAVGEAWPAPEGLCDLLEELRTWQQASGGAFDPGVGALIRAWGLREGGRVPSDAELARARSRSGLALVEVMREPCRATRRDAVLLDAGAFGKGAALDQLADPSLGEATGWMVDLGGQVAVGGGGTAWNVALAHPERRSDVALELRLSTGSLATSGGSERDVVVAGRRLGHVLDPRTGRPVVRSASVSVWHERALVADVLSTALYVMGVEEGLAWAEARGIAACFLVPQGPGAAVRMSPAFAARFPSAAAPVAASR